jgi:hypothetical protein
MYPQDRVPKLSPRCACNPKLAQVTAMATTRTPHQSRAALLAHHGAPWIALKTEGNLEERAKRALRTVGGQHSFSLSGALCEPKVQRPQRPNRSRPAPPT